ncbi:hypothetical protein F0562_025495 [Nyssa sinensis]|uniref:Uncharacterized protein n=1 Tax=Nyssa sinensis TaxID=561372 RepID=A0A5J5B6C4_9ASTE|nr:hypothetical protein F0562_025495 [Nyssa sinensis]
MEITVQQRLTRRGLRNLMELEQGNYTCSSGANELHGLLVRSGLEIDSPVANTLPAIYAKCHCLADARAAVGRLDAAVMDIEGQLPCFDGFCRRLNWWYCE